MQENLNPNPLVSFLVPVYNTETYLRQCLDSLLAQTEPNFEVVCVDDGSTDSSADILAEYAARDARIVVVRQKNQGVSVARNAGIEVARGKYLCCVDSDDWVEPTLCEKAFAVANKYDADVARFIDKRKFAKFLRRYPQAKQYYDGRNLDEALYEEITLEQRLFLIYSLGFGLLQNTLYRRDFWLANSLSFPLGIRINEDAFVCHRALTLASRVVVFDARLYHYRRRIGSAMHAGALARLGSRIDVFEFFRLTRDFYLGSKERSRLYEPLVVLALYSWRNVQVGVSRQERAVWKRKVDELLDDYMLNMIYRRNAAPCRVRQFWLTFYGRNVVEKTFARIVSKLFDLLQNAELFFRMKVRPRLSKKNKRSNC